MLSAWKKSLFFKPVIYGLIAFVLIRILSFENFLLTIPPIFIRKNPVSWEKIGTRLEKIPRVFTLKDAVSAEIPVKGLENTSYVLLDENSKEIIAENNPDKKVFIASLTKIMTAVVALDLAGSEEKFTVTSDAQKIIPTKIGVIKGQKMTLHELLEAMLMTSANDAAQVVMDGVNKIYGGDIFIAAMNKKASLLGLKKMHFENPQGFDCEGQTGSALDLAILSHYALENYPLINEIAKIDYTRLPSNSDHKKFDLYNWNGLLGVYPGACGLKIGFTDRAGHTTVVRAQRGGKVLLAVLLGAPSVLDRDLLTAGLLDYGFAKTLNLPPANITAADLQAKYSTWQYWN